MRNFNQILKLRRHGYWLRVEFSCLTDTLSVVEADFFSIKCRFPLKTFVYDRVTIIFRLESRTWLTISYLIILLRGNSPGKTHCAKYGVEITNQKAKRGNKSSHDKCDVFVTKTIQWEGKRYHKVLRQSFKNTQTESYIVNP